MQIKIGEQTFDTEQIESSEHVVGPPETLALHMTGGATVSLVDTEAALVWEWLLSNIDLELKAPE